MKKIIKHIDFELIILILLSLYMGAIYFSIALSNIFIGLAIFVFLIGWFKNKIQMNFQKKNIMIFFILIIPFILTVFSVLHSEDLNNGLKSVRLRLPILLLPFILVFMKIKYTDLKTTALVFIVLTLAATLITLLKAVNFIGEGILLNHNFTFFITPIQHPYFGVYLLIAFIFVVEFELFPNKILKSFILIVLFAGIIISTSRLAYILLFLTLIFYALRYLNRWAAFLILIIFIISSGAFIGLNKNIQAKFKTSLSYQSSPRLKLWNNAIKVINNSESKLLGIGTGDFYNPKKDPYFFKENEIGLYGYDPHSQIFDFLITNGYLGLFILLACFIIQVKWISGQNRLARFIFIIIISFSLTESILNRQYGVQLYSVFIPLIFSNQLKRPK